MLSSYPTFHYSFEFEAMFYDSGNKEHVTIIWTYVKVIIIVLYMY